MYSAQALAPVAGYGGHCRLGVTDSAITITASKERIGGEALGTWPLDCIRRFTSRVGEGCVYVGWFILFNNDLIYTVDFRSFWSSCQIIIIIYFSTILLALTTHTLSVCGLAILF